MAGPVSKAMGYFSMTTVMVDGTAQAMVETMEMAAEATVVHVVAMDVVENTFNTVYEFNLHQVNLISFKYPPKGEL